MIKIGLEKLSASKKDLLFYLILTLFIATLVAMFLGVPNLRLVGASQDSNGNTVALIENTETKKQDVFDVNQKPFELGNIIDIRDGVVVIEKDDGSTVELTQKTKFKEEQSQKTFDQFGNPISDFNEQMQFGAPGDIDSPFDFPFPEQPISDQEPLAEGYGHDQADEAIEEQTTDSIDF